MKCPRCLKMLFTDPNSPEGFRMRAEMLIEKGVSKDNPVVTMLLKRAEMEEKKK